METDPHYFKVKMRSPNFRRAEISNAALLGNKPLFKGIRYVT